MVFVVEELHNYSHYTRVVQVIGVDLNIFAK